MRAAGVNAGNLVLAAQGASGLPGNTALLLLKITLLIGKYLHQLSRKDIGTDHMSVLWFASNRESTSAYEIHED
jgi:hypothetical protein